MQNLWGFLKDGWKIILVVLNKGQNSSLITFLHQSPIWKADTLFLSKSVEDIHFLDITWNIPPISYMNRPEQFLVVAFTHSKFLFLSF